MAGVTGPLVIKGDMAPFIGSGSASIDLRRGGEQLVEFQWA